MAIRRRKTKGGTSYQVRVHLGDGRYQVIGSYATKNAARDAEAKWLLRKRNREHRRGNEWADFYLAGYRERVKVSSYNAAKNALSRWRETFGTRTLSTITRIEAEEWARENRWAVPGVVTMLNAAVKADVLDSNPFSGLSKKGPGRRHNKPLSVADVERLATAAEKAHGKGIGAFVVFTAYTGMRVGEVFALQWSDIDFKANRVHVRRRLYENDLDLPKANRVRSVVLLPEARDALLGLNRTTEWIFLNKSGGRLSKSALAYYWQKIESGFGRPVQPHELRHFCGHHLYVTYGMQDRLVAEQLGHNDGGELIRKLYGHGDVGALEEIERRYTKRGNVYELRRASGDR